MKIELGQFYLRDGTVYIFEDEDIDDVYTGVGWQNGLYHRFNMHKDSPRIKELIPIDYEMAKLAVFVQEEVDPPKP